MWGKSLRLVFISVCHSACLSAAPRLSLLLPAFFHQPLTFNTVIFFCLLYIPLSASVLPPKPGAPGRQLEAVEGPPDVAGLHGDENPTGGSPLQQEETMVGQPTRRPPLGGWGCGAASAETTASQRNLSIQNVFSYIYVLRVVLRFDESLHMPVSLSRLGSM